jgi:hypothetical protein
LHRKLAVTAPSVLVQHANARFVPARLAELTACAMLAIVLLASATRAIAAMAVPAAPSSKST